MQLSFKKKSVPDTDAGGAKSLADLRCGESGILEALEVPDDLRSRLMELGFFPGGTIVATACAPGGDPRVYRVDGSEVALRQETASRLRLQRAHQRQGDDFQETA